MQKQAPSVGRLLVMVGVRALLLRPAAVPVAGLRRPDAAEAQGLPFKVPFTEATQLANEADVRISGVPVGKVKDIVTPTARRAAPTRRSSSRRSTRRFPPNSRAILRQKTLLGETYVELTPGDKRGAGWSPRTARCAGRAGVARRSSSTRSSAPSTPRPARASSTGCRASRSRVDRPRADLNDALRQPRAVRRGHERAAEDPQRAGRAVAAPRPQHRAWSSTRCASAGASSAA